MKRITLLPIAVVAIAGVGAVTAPAPLHAYQAATPMFVTQIPTGYRDWRLISVAPEEGNLNNQLIRQKGSITDATFEIEFLDPGVEAFSFTFG